MVNLGGVAISYERGTPAERGCGSGGGSDMLDGPEAWPLEKKTILIGFADRSIHFHGTHQQSTGRYKNILLTVNYSP